MRPPRNHRMAQRDSEVAMKNPSQLINMAAVCQQSSRYDKPGAAEAQQ